MRLNSTLVFGEVLRGFSGIGECGWAPGVDRDGDHETRIASLDPERRGSIFRVRDPIPNRSAASRVLGDSRPQDRRHDMRVILIIGSGRDHSTHIYYVIILIA